MKNISEPPPIASRSGLGNRSLSPRTRVLVACSLVGPLLWTATYLIEGVTRPGYDAWQQPISALSLGPGGWVQQVNFVVFGVLTVLSAFGWYRILGSCRAAIGFPLFQSIAGLSLIGTGVFSLDPNPGYPPGAVLTASTVHETLHVVFAYVVIFARAFGCFVLTPRLAREPGWRWWAVYSAITGVLIVFFFLRFIEYNTGPLAGLAERISAGSHSLWSVLLTATLLFRTRPGRG
jgi:uncharacterized membrane protein